MPSKTGYLDEMRKTELEAVKRVNKILAEQVVSQQSQLESHQKQIKKLFAISTEKMRAFCIRDVHESKSQYKRSDRGMTNSAFLRMIEF